MLSATAVIGALRINRKQAGMICKTESILIFKL